MLWVCGPHPRYTWSHGGAPPKCLMNDVRTKGSTSLSLPFLYPFLFAVHFLACALFCSLERGRNFLVGNYFERASRHSPKLEQEAQCGLAARHSTPGGEPRRVTESPSRGLSVLSLHRVPRVRASLPLPRGQLARRSCCPPLGNFFSVPTL